MSEELYREANRIWNSRVAGKSDEEKREGYVELEKLFAGDPDECVRFYKWKAAELQTIRDGKVEEMRLFGARHSSCESFSKE